MTEPVGDLGPVSTSMDPLLISDMPLKKKCILVKVMLTRVGSGTWHSRETNMQFLYSYLFVSQAVSCVVSLLTTETGMWNRILHAPAHACLICPCVLLVQLTVTVVSKLCQPVQQQLSFCKACNNTSNNTLKIAGQCFYKTQEVFRPLVKSVLVFRLSNCWYRHPYPQ